MLILSPVVEKVLRLEVRVVGEQMPVRGIRQLLMSLGDGPGWLVVVRMVLREEREGTKRVGREDAGRRRREVGRGRWRRGMIELLRDCAAVTQVLLLPVLLLLLRRMPRWKTRGCRR